MSNLNSSLAFEEIDDQEEVEFNLISRHLSICNATLPEPTYQVIKVNGNITVSF